MKGLAWALAGLAAAVAARVALSAALPWSRGIFDTFLLVVVYYAVAGSRVHAILMGAAAGLVQDAFASMFLGYHAFVKTAVAYLVGGLGSRFMLNQPVPQFLALLLATVLDGALSALLASLAGLPPRLAAGHLVLRALVNGVAGMLIYGVVGDRPDRRR